jgi:hypothetical protein
VAKAAGSTRRYSPTCPPAHSENIGLFGTITVDIEAELAQLDLTPPTHPPVTDHYASRR